MNSPEANASSAFLTRIVVLMLVGATGVTGVIAFASALHDEELAEAQASARSLRALTLRPTPPPEVVEVLVLPTKAECDLIAPPPAPVVCSPTPAQSRGQEVFRPGGEGPRRSDLELRCRSYLTFAPRGAATTIFRRIGKD